MGYSEYHGHNATLRAITDSARRIVTLVADADEVTESRLRALVGPVGGINGILSRVILDVVQRSEARCAFSSGLALRALVSHLENVSLHERDDTSRAMENILTRHECHVKRFLAMARVPTRSEFDRVISRFITDDVAKYIVLETLTQGGIDGKFTLDATNASVSVPVVESTLGYNFSVNSLYESEWIRNDVKVLVVDGTIEFVHELHRVLESTSTRKFPLLIVARGFGPDVINTLGVNRSRGTIDVLPIAVPMELFQMNTIKDISVACGSELVSSIKGQSIAAIDINDTQSIKTATYRPGLLTVINSSSGVSVGVHRAFLGEQYATAQADVAKLYSARIKSLSPNHTLIKLPPSNDSLGIESLAERVGRGLRLVRAIHEAGVCDTEGGIDVTLRHCISSAFAVNQLSLLASLDGVIECE